LLFLCLTRSRTCGRAQASLLSAALRFATEDPEQSGTRFAELSFLFEGELNPVNSKAQRKVPVPTGPCRLSLLSMRSHPPNHKRTDSEPDRYMNICIYTHVRRHICGRVHTHTHVRTHMLVYTCSYMRLLGPGARWGRFGLECVDPRA
jgi:hypothetical protein